MMRPYLLDEVKQNGNIISEKQPHQLKRFVIVQHLHN